jgi:hypothetical protein
MLVGRYLMNEYEDEFGGEMSGKDFIFWLSNSIVDFDKNLTKQGWPDETSLRDWVHIFLCWVEYEDNK